MPADFGLSFDLAPGGFYDLKLFVGNPAMVSQLLGPCGTIVNNYGNVGIFSPEGLVALHNPDNQSALLSVDPNRDMAAYLEMLKSIGVV